MFRSALILLALGLLASPIAPNAAEAAIWSVEADCEEGDWTVDVELAGFGNVAASCVGGTKTRSVVDVGDVVVTSVAITASSSLGTTCDLPAESESKLTLSCASKSEDAEGLELEDELEVEVELEDEGEEEQEVEDEEA